MPRGRPAKGTPKNGQPAKAIDEAETTPTKAPVAAPEQGTRSSMRLRAQAKVADNKENVATGSKKKPGRKRKAASAASAEENPEDSTAPDVKKDEAAGEEEPAKEELKTVPEEEEPVKNESSDAAQPAKVAQDGEIKVNRAPVLTLWVAAVAERQGFTFDEAVTFGKAIASLFAQSKGKKIFEESTKDIEVETNKKKAKMEKFDVFGNSVYGKTTDKGRFALESGKTIAPNAIKAYLHRAFKDDYDRVREAFEALANSLELEEIGSKAYHLYEKFRPDVPEGARGWGAHGVLDLKHVQALAASG